MTKPNQLPKTQVPTTPSNCFIGVIISGGMAFAMYRLLVAVATSLDNKPIHSNNFLVLNISSLVRNTILGLITMGAGVFSIVSLGLLILGLQVFIQKNNKK